MVTRASEKMIEGLTQMLEGFSDLQREVEEEYQSDDEESEGGHSDEVALEMDAAVVVEMRATLEAVMDTEDYGPDELASFVSVFTEALEEIDPDVFDEEVIEEDEVYEVTEDLDDDELEDFDDDEFDDEDDDEDFEDEDDDD